ncbi:MAG: hypothetical protein JST00_10105 [Deltaproteobacteria bacterium]|nr:hypothetical protein [Deltaproteobacteria bacterium]
MRLVRRRILALALSLVGLLQAERASADPSSTTIAQGYELGETQHPRSIAMGSANQVFGGSTSAIYGNPANLPLYRIYHIEALGGFGPEARRQMYGAAIADSSTSRLAGGFGGSWSQMDPDGIKRNTTDLRLTLAYPLGDRFSLGLTGRYIRVGQRVSSGPFGASYASDGSKDEPLVNEFTVDAGAGFQVTENVRIGLTGKNLTAPGTALVPLILAGGIGYSNGTFTIEGNAHSDFTTWGSARGRYMLGAEYLVADRFPLRIGYRYDDGMKTHALGFGAGYVDRRFSVELGARRDIVADYPSTMVSIGLRFFIDSGGATGSGGDDGGGGI